MKFNSGMALALLLVSAAAQANKPAWSGEGQPDAQQKQQHKEMTKAKRGSELLMSPSGAEQSQQPAHQPEGLSKQQQRTVEQQKELGKGSETGLAAREKRKKWWRFWE